MRLESNARCGAKGKKVPYRTRTSLFEHLEYVLESSPGVETIKMKIKMKFKIDA